MSTFLVICHSCVTFMSALAMSMAVFDMCAERWPGPGLMVSGEDAVECSRGCRLSILFCLSLEWHA